LENHENRHHDQPKSHDVIPLDLLVQVKDREDGENRKRNYFLDGLELRRGELVRPNAIRRDLKALRKKGDAPANDDDFEQRRLAVLQVTIPGKSHKNVGDGEQDDRGHNRYPASNGTDFSSHIGSGGASKNASNPPNSLTTKRSTR